MIRRPGIPRRQGSVPEQTDPPLTGWWRIADRVIRVTSLIVVGVGAVTLLGNYELPRPWLVVAMAVLILGVIGQVMIERHRRETRPFQ